MERNSKVRWVELPAALVLLFAVLGSAGCASVPSSTTDKEESAAILDLEGTPLGQLAQGLADGHESSESGFVLIDRGHDAMAWRAFLAENAVRTIDAQYFIWENDRAGRLLIQRLWDAAERGVRVRVLIDAFVTESHPVYLAKFGAHPNVEVRLYKPFGQPHKSFALRWIDFFGDFKLLNRRMHNKLYIVDSSFLVVGGRNIGEDYFEYVAPAVFRSRDLLSVGPVADQASGAFDMFWNSQWTVPIDQVVQPPPTEQEMVAFEQTVSKIGADPSNYPPGYSDVGDLGQARTLLASELMWGNARVVFDAVPGSGSSPDVPKEATNVIGRELRKLVDQSSEEILAQSPYQVMSDVTLEHLQAAKERGVRIKIVTNSLASIDHISAFAGYRMQRKDQIGAMTELYEYRPDAQSQTEVFHQLAPGQPVPHLAIHAKSSVYDRQIVFVGSFNLDHRSAHLNTETGVLVESEELAQAVAASLLNDMAPGNSWLVRLNDEGKTEWVTIRDGEESIEPESEPMCSSARKAKADLIQPLTPEKQM